MRARCVRDKTRPRLLVPRDFPSRIDSILDELSSAIVGSTKRRDASRRLDRFPSQGEGRRLTRGRRYLAPMATSLDFYFSIILQDKFGNRRKIRRKTNYYLEMHRSPKIRPRPPNSSRTSAAVVDDLSSSGCHFGQDSSREILSASIGRVLVVRKAFVEITEFYGTAILNDVTMLIAPIDHRVSRTRR